MNEHEQIIDEAMGDVVADLIEEPSAASVKLSKWGLFKDLTCLVADLSAATTMAVLIKSHLPEPTNLKHRVAFYIGVPLISGLVGTLAKNQLANDLDDLDTMVDIIRKYMEEH